MRRLVGAALGALAATVVLVVGCKGPMAKIEAVRDALIADDAASIRSATEGYPSCPDVAPVAVAPGQPGPLDQGCLTEIANALGSKKGFSTSPPDQAAGTTAALVLLRDGRGDFMVHADSWLGAIKTGKGQGIDALRLAVARKMAEAAPLVGRRIEDDAAANETMKAVVGAVPGACPTYWLLGSGADPAKIPAELTADHAACVHKDLKRREGPGGSYGEGTFRALEGSLALWREAERALRLGLSASAPDVKAAVEKKLGVIEPATQKIDTKKSESTLPRQVLEYMGDAHADAGVYLWKPKDAGADGAAEAGAPGDAGATSDAGSAPTKK